MTVETWLCSAQAWVVQHWLVVAVGDRMQQQGSASAVASFAVVVVDKAVGWPAQNTLK